MSKGAQTRTRIMDTAEALILQKGFSGTSIDEIIAEADITKGGFFYHFRGKSELARELVERYIEQDEAFFTSLVERAESLVEDPYQRALLFLKLLAEAMADLPGTHPGCLVASFTYESQHFDPTMRERMAEGIARWRALFVARFAPILDKYTLPADVELETLADMLTSTIEGGIIVSKALNDPAVLVNQLLQFRMHLRLLVEGRD